ncbi:flagellar motor switch protein FliM [bacterium]|nr:flagellar motor switch protein FliM [bacterium]
MSEVLSQSEIDALLFAVSSGNVDTTPPGGAAAGAGQKEDWVAYDLTSEEKIYHGKLVGLTGIHERFARLLRRTLTGYFKKKVTISVTNTDFLKFGDYISNLTLPTALNLVSMPSLHGHMLYVVSSKLLYAFIDAYYGGIERPFAKLGQREEFTSIENNMVRKITDMVITDLKEAWRLNYPLDLAYERTESNPAFVGTIHHSDLVAAVTFEIEFENLSGPCTLVLQLRSLDSVQQALSINVTAELDQQAGQWREHWLRELAQTHLDVRAELGTASKQLKEVQAWKVGDVLTLNQDTASPLVVYLEQMAKLRGLMGVYRGSVAVRLVGDDGKV